MLLGAGAFTTVAFTTVAFTTVAFTAAAAEHVVATPAVATITAAVAYTVAFTTAAAEYAAALAITSLAATLVPLNGRISKPHLCGPEDGPPRHRSWRWCVGQHRLPPSRPTELQWRRGQAALTRRACGRADTHPARRRVQGLHLASAESLRG